MSVIVTEVSFEHHRSCDLLGIGESCPRISWKFGGEAKDWKQEKYEIEFVREGSPAPERYAVESEHSLQVPWPSSPLKSGESASMRVRSSGKGIDAPWSKSYTIEAGLLSAEDWKAASMIKCPKESALNKMQPVLFRKQFTLTKPISKARLYVTSHGIYEAEINKAKIGDHVLAPGWTPYEHELLYQTFDVTNAVHNGDNVIGVHVADGWYRGRLGFVGGFSNIWGCQLGALLQLSITYTDGCVELVTTDDSWKYNASYIESASIYDGESIDLLKKQPWSSTGFQDQSWLPVEVVGFDYRLLRSPDGPPIRQTQELAVQEVITSPSGKTILDFGQNFSGWVRFKIPPGPAGHLITLIHTEVLENGEAAVRPLRIARCTENVRLSGNPATNEVYEPRFTFHGFRFCQVSGWPVEKLNQADFTAVVIHTDMQPTASFDCSNDQLNRLHKNVTWSMRGNFVGVPTDCPQRDERLGYTGDLQAFCSTATFLYDCQGMLRNWLRGLANEQRVSGTGVPPIVSPDVVKLYGLQDTPFAIWGDCVILSPWDLYQSSGDSRILADQFDSMESWIEKGIPRNEKGLWAETPRGQLGDWLDPTAPPDRPGEARTDPLLVANAFLVRISDVMASICAVLGFVSKAKKYEEQAANLRKAFADDYITPNGLVVADSQTAIALAILFSLFPTPEQEKFAASRLDSLIRCKSRFKIATGFAGTPILGHALTKVDKTHLFYRMLLNRKCPSWLYTVTMGSTTIWERWDSMLPDGSVNPGEMTSFNHYALGAVASWMHSVIGGLKIAEPGWKKFRVEPVPGGQLTAATTCFDSPYGQIKSSWSIKDGVMTLEVRVPPGTCAEVAMPGSDSLSTIGSGVHNFEVQWIEPERPQLPPSNPFIPDDDDEDSLKP